MTPLPLSKICQVGFQALFGRESAHWGSTIVPSPCEFVRAVAAAKSAAWAIAFCPTEVRVIAGGCSTVSVSFTHGYPYFVHIWAIFGLYLVHRSTFGPHLVYIWSIFGPYLVHIWSIFGPYLVHRSTFGPYLVHIWSMFGPYLVHI